jgi:Flp pilus assembly protein TadB
MRRRTERPQLITDAPQSPEAELRAREVRYVIMMSLRAVCVITGAILVMVRPPLLGVWLVVCVVGAVVLPWAAVLLANDKAPRADAKLRNRLHKQPEAPPAAPNALPQTQTEVPHKVIDVDN